MSRIRSVHPGLFTDEAWVSCSPLARILVIGLWTDADDQGVFEWKPLQIKMRLLPGDAANCGELLEEIQRAGMVMAYEVDGKRYGAIKNFRKFQRPQKPNALHPLPETIRLFVHLLATDPQPVQEESTTSTVIPPQMEDVGGKREEEQRTTVAKAPVVPRAKPKGSRRCPAEWPPQPADIDFGVSLGLTPGQIERELAKLKDHEYRAPRSDWSAAFRNWLRNAAPHDQHHRIQTREPLPDARRANTERRRDAWLDVVAERDGGPPGQDHNGGRASGAGGDYPGRAAVDAPRDRSGDRDGDRGPGPALPRLALQRG